MFNASQSATAAPEVKELFLKDYTPPSHLITQTHLTFELLSEEEVIVSSKLLCKPNPDFHTKQVPNTIALDGAPEKNEPGSATPTMAMLEIKLNNNPLPEEHYQRLNETLTINDLPEEPFTLEIKTRINPKANRSLSGLYTSGGKFTTQCESQGFRNITFYLDRPDVMSEYFTTIIAPKGQYPQLLSNGNPGDKTMLPDGRESITWHDPFKKPSYLFALVAGDFASLKDTFTTCSGRKVDIHIYVDHGDEGKIHHAMEAVKQSMKWDEERFGREYDLDLFQIVAVHDFNFGAMENKGLNIFNSSAILADPNTATDARYEYVQAVVGHEYFHNWSGDRVTCRDWFQLSLKEGFTVFRDAEFTSDLNSRPVKRIDDVIGMRTAQFPEDAGAMAHPIRPASVGSIENFYTATVYQKGAEVIRMIHTLLGEEKFRKGSDLYFERHDGQAVTTEDFVKAMEDASGVDLSQFENTWYNQSGTPVVNVSDSYDATEKTYHLTLKQETPPTPGQPTKTPYHIPIQMGLLSKEGKELPLSLNDKQKMFLGDGHVLNFKEKESTFVFENIDEKPTPSLLRNWSAPVKLNYDYSREQLMFLMAHDTDGFNRWEAAQQLGILVLKDHVQVYQQNKEITLDEHLLEAFRAILCNPKLDPALAARTLILPSSTYLAELYPDGEVDIDAIYHARKTIRTELGKALYQNYLERFESNRRTEKSPYQWNVKDSGERAIKNTCLAYLVAGNPTEAIQLALQQFDLNHNMTDVRAAFSQILDFATPADRDKRIQQFYETHQHNPLAIQQWFTDQVLADREDVLDQVKTLLKHPAYEPTNPNFVRSVVGAFSSNLVRFHAKTGEGYLFIADQLLKIDEFNPSLAAGLTKRLSTPHRFDKIRQGLIKTQLEKIHAQAHSNNVKEIAGKSLKLLAEKSG
jgi:aminopeptidase N